MEYFKKRNEGHLDVIDRKFIILDYKITKELAKSSFDANFQAGQ